ncbi:TPA: Lar family restriction alleviation protein [Burkholderia vietnamiensis]|nr:Lar family restriction alleviation protein [Burkholderia vietnamiensis]
MSELKPRPFCGSHEVQMYSGAFVSCLDCGSDGPIMESDEQAAEAWNRRAPASEGEQK